jgi:hypothetical protein
LGEKILGGVSKDQLSTDADIVAWRRDVGREEKTDEGQAKISNFKFEKL